MLPELKSGLYAKPAHGPDDCGSLFQRFGRVFEFEFTEHLHASLTQQRGRHALTGHFGCAETAIVG